MNVRFLVLVGLAVGIGTAKAETPPVLFPSAKIAAPAPSLLGAAQQTLDDRLTDVLTPRDYAARAFSRPPAAPRFRSNMPTKVPDESRDYKLRIVPPDDSRDYKLLIAPGDVQVDK